MSVWDPGVTYKQISMTFMGEDTRTASCSTSLSGRGKALEEKEDETAIRTPPPGRDESGWEKRSRLNTEKFTQPSSASEIEGISQVSVRARTLYPEEVELKCRSSSLVRRPRTFWKYTFRSFLEVGGCDCFLTAG